MTSSTGLDASPNDYISRSTSRSKCFFTIPLTPKTILGGIVGCVPLANIRGIGRNSGCSRLERPGEGQPQHRQNSPIRGQRPFFNAFSMSIDYID